MFHFCRDICAQLVQLMPKQLVVLPESEWLFSALHEHCRFIKSSDHQNRLTKPEGKREMILLCAMHVSGAGVCTVLLLFVTLPSSKNTMSPVLHVDVMLHVTWSQQGVK